MVDPFDAFILGCGVGAAAVAFIVYVAGRWLMTNPKSVGNQK